MPPANYWPVEGFFPFNTYKCIVRFLLGKAKKREVTNLILVQSEDAHHQHICGPAERSVPTRSNSSRFSISKSLRVPWHCSDSCPFYKRQISPNLGLPSKSRL